MEPRSTGDHRSLWPGQNVSEAFWVVVHLPRYIENTVEIKIVYISVLIPRCDNPSLLLCVCVWRPLEL